MVEAAVHMKSIDEADGAYNLRIFSACRVLSLVLL